jgi:hypothetical protein
VNFTYRRKESEGRRVSTLFEAARAAARKERRAVQFMGSGEGFEKVDFLFYRARDNFRR